MNIYLSIKQKTWSNLSSLISHNLDHVLIPSQNTWLSSCMVTWLSHDKTLPPRHGWLHPSSRLLAWFDFVPGDLIRGQVVPLVMTVVGGERRSAYSWRASLSALHTLGEGEVVQSTRQGYSWRTSFQTGFSTTKHKAKQINIVSSLFVVVKCSQVYWISQYNQKFTFCQLHIWHVHVFTGAFVQMKKLLFLLGNYQKTDELITGYHWNIGLHVTYDIWFPSSDCCGTS